MPRVEKVTGAPFLQLSVNDGFGTEDLGVDHSDRELAVGRNASDTRATSDRAG